MAFHRSRRLRTRSVGVRLAVAAAVVGFVMVVQDASPASASCLAPPELAIGFNDAEVVFVGEVIELANRGRTAIVEVVQVWKGPELPATVVVRGGPGDPGVFSSVDRTFERDTYVFFPVSSAPPFEDNACTLTQLRTPDQDVINPFANEPVVDVASDAPVTSVTSDEVPRDVTTSDVPELAQPETTATDDVAQPTEPESTLTRSGSSRAFAIGGGLAALAVAAGGAAWHRTRPRTSA